MIGEEISKPDHCLNCGTSVSKNYCPECGQKVQSTSLPIRLFLEDAVESLFNIDNRWLKTLRDLFVHPGKVTREYIEGKRAKYLPPLRLYLSVSLVYFLLIQLTESTQVFLISISDSGNADSHLGAVVQYGMFLLVPVMAWIAQLFYRKRKAYYVEYLIFAFHIHTLWFLLLIYELLVTWAGGYISASWAPTAVLILSLPARIGVFAYLILYIKKTFSKGWAGAIGKSMAIMLLYLIVLAAFTTLYIFQISKLFS